MSKDYENLFKLFKLEQAEQEYKNAEHHARNFERCTILNDAPITYSSGTGYQIWAQEPLDQA